MKELLRFSRGDFYGTTTLLILIIIVYAFLVFYKPKHDPVTDWGPYQAEINRFYERQQFYEDSLRQTAEERQQKYAHRDYGGRHPPYKAGQGDSTKSKDSTFRKRAREYEIVKIDLNRCDSNDIMRVPQFGSKRAAKIIEYRDKLGGFHSLQQLHEIYILQKIDLRYCEEYFYVDRSHIQRIAINKADYKELIAHPYFDAYLAKTIIAHREAHGKIKDKNEFQAITHAYEVLMEKLSPYLDFE